MPSLSALLRVPDSEERVRFWHISPLIDTVAYHWGWLLVLVPLFFYGDDRRTDYFALFMVVLVLNFTHRQASFPYVYLDKQVFSRHPTRFVVVPLLLGTGLFCTYWYYGWKVPVEFFSPVGIAAFVAGFAAVLQLGLTVRRLGELPLSRHLPLWLPPLAALVAHASGAATGLQLEAAWLAALTATTLGYSVMAGRRGGWASALVWLVPGLLLAAIGSLLASGTQGVWPTAPYRFKDAVYGVFFAGFAWNVWHTFMQKYGILRMYSAKSEVAEELRVPGWVDRWLAWCWLPLVVVVLATRFAPEVASGYKRMNVWLDPVVASAQSASYALYPLGVAVLVGAVLTWLRYEYRATGLKNWARNSMALGTFLSFSAFLFMHPVKVYVALGFGHALEYIVFVWAFQRKRYAHPLAHNPPLGRILQRPWLAYAAFFLFISGGYWFLQYSDDFLFDKSLRFLDTSLGRWAFWITIWGQLAHFYYDGFLWKMRLPSVRASL